MKKKIIITLLASFIIAMIIMSVAIFIAYTSAYKTGVGASTVKLLGLPIYEIFKSGTKYKGQSKGIYMGAFCGICMLSGVFIEVFIDKLLLNRHKKSY